LRYTQIRFFRSSKFGFELLDASAADASIIAANSVPGLIREPVDEAKYDIIRARIQGTVVSVTSSRGEGA
jgi:hypothetical protein